MSAETIHLRKREDQTTIPEILFGVLLGFTAISGIWFSSSFLLHLFG